jgi:polysaccharide biosynthesis transport protein
LSSPQHFDEQREGGSVLGLMGPLRRRWVLIVVIVLACMVAAVIHSERSTKLYKATASVSFQSSSASAAALQLSTGGSTEPQREANTEVLIAHSPEVARNVVKELHLDVSPGQLLSEVQAEVAPTANVLNIVASTGDPAASAKLANAFAEQYIAFRSESKFGEIDQAQSRLQKQIEALPAGSAERANLVQSQQRLGELRAIAGGGASIIGRASAPSSPSGTTLKAWVIIGLLIGIATSVLVVFFLESLDRRVRSPEQFEREYRLPTLTVVPRSAFRERRALARGDELEPYRMLRSALEFTAAARTLKTLMVTSAVSSEGKTTVAIDFAHAVALTGRQTILVEMDLRRPSFARQLDIDERGGVSAALVGSATLESLLVEPIEGLDTLHVLPAGRLPHNPAELLGSQRTSDIIKELAQMAEMVIIDMPPINPVADAQILLNNDAVNGVLLVARLDRTKRDDVRRAREILDRHAVRPVGLVIAGAHGSLAYGAKYSYPANGKQVHVGQPQRGADDRSSATGIARPSGSATRQRLSL